MNNHDIFLKLNGLKPEPLYTKGLLIACLSACLIVGVFAVMIGWVK